MTNWFKHFCLILVGTIATLVLTPLRLEAAPNTLVISETAGAALSQYPVTFGRPFKEGEIPQFPQARIDGNPVLTQADVKNRYNDGSVKFAIISFVIPALAANQSITIDFQNAPTGNNANSLDRAGMLGSNFSFDAEIAMTNGSVTESARARTLLENQHFTYWLQGPIVTAVILADHSNSRTHDLGFDSHRSFRPIFHAYFYPSSQEVKVHIIGENSNTEAAQDLTYNLQINLGTQRDPIYTKSQVRHHAFSRWIRKFSLRPHTGRIKIDMNTEYLVESKFLPNYDLTLRVPESAIVSDATQWAGRTKDLFDGGLWMRGMPSAGGRPDIGPHTDYTTRFLFTWDPRSQKLVFENADLAAAWPMHFREGRLGKHMDRAQTIPAIGKPISINARPSLFMFDGNGYLNDGRFTHPNDMVTLVGPVSDGGWTVDCSHQPEVWFIPYMVSGEFWYLEQLQFWSARNAFFSNPTNETWGRNRVYGAIQDQTRGQAWSLRTRTLTAFISPDGTPERDYFNRLMIDAIAIWEGLHGISGSALAQTEEFQWARADWLHYWGSNQMPPLKFWGHSAGVRASATEINPAVTSEVAAPWEYSFLLAMLGRAKELGYPTDHLISYVSEFFTSALTSSAVPPQVVGVFQIPYRKLDRSYFNSWTEIQTGYYSNFDFVGYYNGQLGDVVHGYPHINRAAFSFITQEPLGNIAWAFVQPQTGVDRLNENPKWAINPRTQVSNNVLFLASLQPNAVRFDQGGTVRLFGTNFDPAFQGLEINDVLFSRSQLALTHVSTTEISWAIAPNQYQPGRFTVRVVNPNNQKSNALTLNITAENPSPAPQINRINPASVSNASQSIVAIEGLYFDVQNAQVRLNNIAVAAQRINRRSPQHIDLIVPAGTLAQSYFVTIINGNQQMSNAMTLTVTSSAGSGGGNGSGNGSGGSASGGGVFNGGTVRLAPSSGVNGPEEAGDIAGFGCQQRKTAHFDLSFLGLVLAFALWAKKRKNAISSAH